MYIKELRIHGFKRFSHLRIKLSPGVNILVGDNDSGKSTLFEAIVAVLNGQYRGVPIVRNLSEDLFNAELVSDYLEGLKSGQNCDPPEILIEVVFDGTEDTVALYEGDGNSEGIRESGVSLRIALDNDTFAEEYQGFIDSKEYFGIPIEYYSCNWSTFARKSIRPVGIKFGASLIGSGNTFAWANSKSVVSRIARNVLEPSDQIAISQVHRRMRNDFSSNDVISQINEKISQKTRSLTRKTVTFGFEASTISSWENGIVTKLGDIPFSNVGDGTRGIITTELALSKSKDCQRDVILLEEPENHLSHTRLNMFLDDIKERCEGMQLVVTTHSSFVANKLELRRLHLLNGNHSTTLADLHEDTSRFFMKSPGYKTLRILLCEVSILVEGDADELVLQRAYSDMHNGRLPINDGIDIISVGTSFLRFMEIAEAVGKHTIAVTDNDGDIEARHRKYWHYALVTSSSDADYQVVSYPTELLPEGNEKRVNYNTLESEIYESAGAEILSKILQKTIDNRDGMLKYMEGHKTDVALAIFDSTERIRYPDYIVRAINWASSKAGISDDD